MTSTSSIAWASSAMDMEGEDRPGVWSGIALLEKVAKGEKVSLGDRAVIVGGGNTAVEEALYLSNIATKVLEEYSK